MKRVDCLRKLMYILNRRVLEKLYFAYIRPLMEYADVLWHNCTEEQCARLERVQLAAARVVSGASRHAPNTLLYEETQWEPLYCRREKHKLVYMYKIVHGIAPAYLNTRIPQVIPSGHNLRNENDIPLLPCRTKLWHDSYFPSTIQLWNSLGTDIKSKPTITSFKKKLNSTLVKVPGYYSQGARRGQILHARLRTQSSSLNDHLYRHNLVDNPKCSCGKIETTKHFLLDCPMYAHLRTQLFSSLPESTSKSTNTLLFGDTNLTDSANCKIFMIVHDYIIHTKRF